MIETTEISESTVLELQKSQNIRLVDVFVIAPILFYAGMQQSLDIRLRYVLIIIALCTLYYNGKNYLENKEK